MRRLRIIFWSLLGMLVAAVVTVAAVRYWDTTTTAKAMPVRPGDQEIAFFNTTTGASTWERIVAGTHYAARLEPKLQVDDSHAFLDQTTAVPEVVLGWQGSDHHLVVRWYKQSSQVKVGDWVRALAARDQPPLAILGGGSSDRALELARVLDQTSWHGSPPLLLLTTATANSVYIEDEPVRRDLMQVYKDRTFRFCFTNQQMANATLDFVWMMPELRPQGNPLASLAAVPQPAGGDFLGSLSWLLAQSHFPPEVFAVEWKDDPYSIDLSEQFRGMFFNVPDGQHAQLAAWQQTLADRGAQPVCLPIHSSVGGYIRPNQGEADAIDLLLSDPPRFPLPRSLPRQPLQRSLLILPAVVQPARRLLAGLTGSAPLLGRNLVAVAGDAISFNNVYRDADLVWNIRLVPAPLVFFTHQNPVAWDADIAPAGASAERSALYPPNGTDDVLHFADVIRLIAEGGFSSGALVKRSEELAEHLRRRDPPFFDTDGNRLGGSGEYIAYLRPDISPDDPGGGRVYPSATLEVWGHQRNQGWHMVKEPLPIRYR